MKIWTLLLAAVIGLTAFTDDAEAARRIGGGQSVGRQSSNVTKREQSQPPANQAAPQQNAAKPQTPPPAQPQPSRWGGILGGLAAGLGLAWLAHTLGFGPR